MFYEIEKNQLCLESDNNNMFSLLWNNLNFFAIACNNSFWINEEKKAYMLLSSLLHLP